MCLIQCGTNPRLLPLVKGGRRKRGDSAQIRTQIRKELHLNRTVKDPNDGVGSGVIVDGRLPQPFYKPIWSLVTLLQKTEYYHLARCRR